MGDLGLRHARTGCRRRRRRSDRSRPPRLIGAPASRAASIMRTMWSRFIVASNTVGVPANLGGAVADGVHLDVIGVAVVAVPVVDREHVGVLLAQDRRPAARRPRRRAPAGTTRDRCSAPTPSSRCPCSRATRRGGRRAPRPSARSRRAGDRPASHRRRDRRAPRRSRRSWRSPATTRWPSALARAREPPVLIDLVVGVSVKADQCSHQDSLRSHCVAGSPGDDSACSRSMRQFWRRRSPSRARISAVC